MGNLGEAYASLGKTALAIEYYERRLEIAQEIGDRRAESSAFHGLGSASLAMGDPQRAIEFFERSSAIDREIGSPEGRVGLGIA